MAQAPTNSLNAPTAAPRLLAGGRSLVPELLSPAGDWECVKAAVENGADAIYFGLERFNARMRAKNFTQADLPALMEFLHRRGVRGYVTFNTLVFPDELVLAEQYLRSIIAAGVDAEQFRPHRPASHAPAATRRFVGAVHGTRLVRQMADPRARHIGHLSAVISL